MKLNLKQKCFIVSLNYLTPDVKSDILEGVKHPEDFLKEIDYMELLGMQPKTSWEWILD